MGIAGGGGPGKSLSIMVFLYCSFLEQWLFCAITVLSCVHCVHNERLHTRENL